MMSTSTAIKLTDAELNQIVADRAAKEAAEIKAKADQAAADAAEIVENAKRHEATVARKTKEQTKIIDMVDKLVAEDTDNIFTVETDIDVDTQLPVPFVTFEVGSRKFDVCVNEKYSTTRFRHVPTGVFQYTINGDFTDYKARNYKSPKSLVKKVAEFKEIAECQRQAALRKKNLSADTMSRLIAQHPTAEVKMYEPNGWADLASKYYTTYHVTTDKGVVSYTSRYDQNGDFELNVFDSKVNDKALKAEVINMILN